MVHRTPARWLAPLALVGAVIAVLLVTTSGGGKPSGSAGNATVTESSAGATTTATTASGPRHRSYVVKPGDTLSAIAAKTGVALDQIMRLNPHVDAQTLTVGQRLKLVP